MYWIGSKDVFDKYKVIWAGEYLMPVVISKLIMSQIRLSPTTDSQTVNVGSTAGWLTTAKTNNPLICGQRWSSQPRRKLVVALATRSVVKNFCQGK